MEFNFELAYTPAQLKVFPDADTWSDISWRFMIVPKGRRSGITQGAEKSIIEYCLNGITPILWVDTINGNIDRYFERYFRNDLKKLPQGWWNWNAIKRILEIKNTNNEWSIVDFRSADNPESIEGFGYRLIFLNEAGIILHDDYLYSRALLPMMLDFPDSKLIAAGVPKGRTKKDGTSHKFYDLYTKALNGAESYRLVELTSFDNPLLNKSDIEEIISELSPAEADQEIYGRFVDMAGRNPFAHQYEAEHHESESAVKREGIPLIISADFNLNPFSVIFSNIWKDGTGLHDHTFDEASIARGSIPAMIELILERYKNDLPSCMMTGDTGGNSEQLSLADRSSFFRQLKSGLNLKDRQIIVPRSPSHYVSRNDVNYFLHHSKPDAIRNLKGAIDVKINPKTCPQLCRDMIAVQVDAYGEIIKKNRKDVDQRADFLDAYRYKINTFWKKWIIQQQQKKSMQR